MSPDLLRAMVKTFADALMSSEADALCNAEYGQVSDERVNHRNGYRPCVRGWSRVERHGFRTPALLPVPARRVPWSAPSWASAPRTRYYTVVESEHCQELCAFVEVDCNTVHSARLGVELIEYARLFQCEAQPVGRRRQAATVLAWLRWYLAFPTCSSCSPVPPGRGWSIG